MIRDEDAFVKALSVYFIRLCGPDGGIFAYFLACAFQFCFTAADPLKDLRTAPLKRKGACWDVWMCVHENTVKQGIKRI